MFPELSDHNACQHLNSMGGNFGLDIIKINLHGDDNCITEILRLTVSRLFVVSTSMLPGVLGIVKVD